MRSEPASQAVFASKPRKLSALTRTNGRAVVGWCLYVAAIAAFLDVSSFAEDGYVILSTESEGSLQQVQVVLEVRGELRVKGEGGKVTKLPLLVEGGLKYDERLLESKQSPWARRSVRYYTQSEARIKVGTGTLTRTLSPNHQLLVAQTDKDGTTRIFSPASPLTRDEFDLVDVQGNSLALGCLLPAAPVKIGDQWKADSERLAILLGLEVVTQQAVVCTLSGVEQRTATIEIKGDVDGAVCGVPAKVTLHAKCNYDLAQKAVTWFAAVIKEQRDIGQAEPGLDVVARLRMSLSPVERSEHLTETQLAGVALDARPGTDLLAFQAERSHFRLLHDRRWRAVLDRHDVCVLRLVDRGDLIAQCNISELPDQEAGKQITLEEFQADIQRGIGKNFGQFLEAHQSTRDDGRRVLRVVVSGMASEVPIQWVYYQLSDATGRRAALAFTLEAKLVERFAENDRTLAETVEFLPRPQPAKAAQQPRDKNRS